MKKLFLLLIIVFIFNNNFVFSQKIETIRGTWLTNVDSDVLKSKKKIIEAVNLCDKIGINTIFVVTWNKGVTLYKSKTMKETFGVEIDPIYGKRDPIRELIEVAHKKNIKVIGWFEFGFSSSYAAKGIEIMKRKPEWASIDTTGNVVVKNGFEWMNGFHPDVQIFMLNMIMDLVKNYNIDGIQGDDRLPAMPCEAGYDDYTINLYKSEHNGATPPRNCKDTMWTDWRAKKLNDFMEKIFRTVKAHNPKVIVSMAPSIFPWAKEEYLQDWPTWLQKGLVEFVCPQDYRYEIEKYENELKNMVNEQVSPANVNRLYPGILLKLGKYYPSEDMLRKMIKINRKNKVNGEVFFFYEGLKKFEKLFKELYKDKKNVVFPNF